MNFQRGTARDEPEINLIPLIDVLLVVVIFLVVTTTYARFAELEIKLPQANADPENTRPEQVAIGVDASGHYRVNEIVVQSQDVQSLADALLKAANGRKDSAIVISADAQATHQSVVRVMDAARRVGLNRVTFVTQTTASDTP